MVEWDNDVLVSVDEERQAVEAGYKVIKIPVTFRLDKQYTLNILTVSRDLTLYTSTKYSRKYNLRMYLRKYLMMYSRKYPLEYTSRKSHSRKNNPRNISRMYSRKYNSRKYSKKYSIKYSFDEYLKK